MLVATIPLRAIPNQSVTLVLNSNTLEIEVLLGNSKTTLLGITVNGVSVLSGYPMAAGDDAICRTPASVNAKMGGFFFFECGNDSYPQYEMFGTSHSLIWVSQ